MRNQIILIVAIAVGIGLVASGAYFILKSNQASKQVIQTDREVVREERDVSSSDSALEEDEEEGTTAEALDGEPNVYMTRYFVEDAGGRKALCNDGSDAVYFFSEGTGDGADKWVIWFEGGGGCYDEESCADRWQEQKYLMTSNTTASRVQKGGILSASEDKNPDFYNWNHVMLNYCSSDNWIGDAVNEVAGQEMYFYGTHIVQAVFEDLMNPEIHEMNLLDASKVLITGTSAGGGGAAQNMNRIATWLHGIDVRGVIDSSWEVESTSLMSEEELREFSNDVIEYRGGQLDLSCLEEHRTDPSACQYVSNLYPYFSVPVFIYIDQYDKKKLTSRFAITDPKDPEQRAIIESHAEAIRHSLEGLDGVFSPQKTWHGTLTNNRLFAETIDGHSFYEVLGNWYFDREGPIALIEE